MPAVGILYVVVLLLCAEIHAWVPRLFSVGVQVCKKFKSFCIKPIPVAGNLAIEEVAWTLVMLARILFIVREVIANPFST